MCVILATVTSCTDPEAESEEIAVTTEASSPSGSSTEEDAVLAVYTGMWAAVVDGSHGDQGSALALDEYAVGAARELMRSALDQAITLGQTTGEPILDPTAHVQSDERATIDDCLDDSDWGFGQGTSSAAGPRQVDATLIHDGLAWRVSELRIWETGSC